MPSKIFDQVKDNQSNRSDKIKNEDSSVVYKGETDEKISSGKHKRTPKINKNMTF